jgi:SET domain-containing protein
MTSGELRTLFDGLGIEYLASNRYRPASLAFRDVTRTRYYRRSKNEFKQLEEAYGPALQIGGRDGAPVEQGLTIRRIDDIMGYGLFAARLFAPGDLIGEYTGIVRPARRGRPLPGGGYSTDYAWGFPKVRDFGRSLEIDAREAGGPLRFANHSGEVNAEPDHLAIEGRWRVIFIARRNIETGEEITVDYGQAYWVGGERELMISPVAS